MNFLETAPFSRVKSRTFNWVQDFLYKMVEIYCQKYTVMHKKSTNIKYLKFSLSFMQSAFTASISLVAVQSKYALWLLVQFYLVQTGLCRTTLEKRVSSVNKWSASPELFIIWFNSQFVSHEKDIDGWQFKPSRYWRSSAYWIHVTVLRSQSIITILLSNKYS